MSSLRGLRVVELVDERTFDAGRMLRELGAELVLVEREAGSPLRSRGPFVDDVTDLDGSLYWWSGAVGARSVALDLGSAEGRAAFQTIVRDADIVLEGQGLRLEDRGLGWESLGSTVPTLIWVSITEFGRESARDGTPATDLTLLAGGGPMWNCGYDDHSLPPIRGQGEQAYKIGAWYAAIGALVALAHRDRTGRGQLVDVNLNAACNVTCEHVTYNWLVAKSVCRRQTGRHASSVQTVPVQVRCSDGRYATTGVLPRLPAEFARLHSWMAELGLVDQLPEAVFLERAAGRSEPVEISRIGEDDEVAAMLGAARDAIKLIAASLSAHAFFVEGQRRGFAVGAIVTPDEAFEDPHVIARGFPVEVTHAERGRTIRYPGLPFVFSACAPIPPSRPPRIGEHTDEVLDEARRRAHMVRAVP
jgi:crotonobetainyl-CoA:carnitine CoA-transferase CaiB-like acyl-CoA transferase